MKILGPRGMITVVGDVRTAYTYEKDTLDMAAALELSIRMDQVLVASTGIDPEELEIPTKKPSKDAIMPKPKDIMKVSLGLEATSETVTIGTNLDPK